MAAGCGSGCPPAIASSGSIPQTRPPPQGAAHAAPDPDSAQKTGGFWRSHSAGSTTERVGPLHVHHKLSTSLCRHSGLTTLRATLTSSWKSMEKSDGCQEKIVPRSETYPQKGQTQPAATGCADAAAVPKPLAALTRRRTGQLYRPAQSPADRKN